jgi:hypothetical protein
MMKTFLLAKDFYRYCALIFRNHETPWNLAGWIPGGVFTPVTGQASRRRQPSMADITIPRRATEADGTADQKHRLCTHWPQILARHRLRRFH